jgi:di/tricarboxylate transporter
LPDLPSIHAVLALALVAVTIYLFAVDRYGPPTTGLGVLLALTLGAYLFPYPGLKPSEFFASFGDEALVTVCTLLLLTKGLEVTGALQPLTRLLVRSWQLGRVVALPVMLLVAACSSGFINDTPLMAILFPVILGCALRYGTAPSRVLLPLNYAVLIGGMTTTIGTSTNLIALGVADDLGVGSIGLFDLAPPAMLAVGLGLAFTWMAATWLLPERPLRLAEGAARVYSAVLHVNMGGFAQGRSLGEVVARTQNRMQVDRIARDEDLTVNPLPSTTLLAGDRLYLRDTAAHLKEYEGLLGATLYSAGDLQHPVSDKYPLDTGGQQLAEVVITRGSPLYQRTLDGAEFFHRYRLLPLAVHRGRSVDALGSETETARLRAGDVILAQGTGEAIRELKASGSMLVLDGTVELPRSDRAGLALVIAATVIGVVALELMAVSVAALLGVALMLATRCLKWRHIPETLNTSLLMVMVSSLCLATAITKTGAAEYVAALWVAALPELPAWAMLGLVMLGVTVLTNFVTNNIAAAVAVPVGIFVARQIGAPEEAFVMAVIFGANMPFATPYGYQTNTLIMSAGGYVAADYARIGIPLTAIMWPALTAGLGLFYDLR